MQLNHEPTLAPTANPLDMMEELVNANEWRYDRSTDEEMIVEFTGQLFQLTRGGREARLRNRALMPTLAACATRRKTSSTSVWPASRSCSTRAPRPTRS